MPSFSAFLCRYTANLAAHLTTKIPTAEFESIEDLRRLNIPLYLYGSHHYKQFFNRVHSEDFKQINKNGQFWYNATEIPYHLQKGRAIFGTESIFDRVRQRNCSQMFRTFGQTGVVQKAFAMRKNHFLFPNISRKILEYLTLGIITEIDNKYKPSCPLREDNILPSSSLANMKGLLVVTTSLALIGVFGMFARRSLNSARKIAVLPSSYDAVVHSHT